jgi:hypothetical protein
VEVEMQHDLNEDSNEVDFQNGLETETDVRIERQHGFNEDFSEVDVQNGVETEIDVGVEMQHGFNEDSSDVDVQDQNGLQTETGATHEGNDETETEHGSITLSHEFLINHSSLLM